MGMKGLVGSEAAGGEDAPSCPDADAGQCRESVHEEGELCEWRYCSGQAANHSAALQHTGCICVAVILLVSRSTVCRFLLCHYSRTFCLFPPATRPHLFLYKIFVTGSFPSAPAAPHLWSYPGRLCCHFITFRCGG